MSKLELLFQNYYIYRDFYDADVFSDDLILNNTMCKLTKIQVRRKNPLLLAAASSIRIYL